MLENEENTINKIEGIEKLKFKLRFMKRCKILKRKLDDLFLSYKLKINLKHEFYCLYLLRNKLN